MKTQLAVLLISQALLEAVPEGGMPNGHLYAAVMAHIGLESYTQIIEQFKAINALTEHAHFLERGSDHAKMLRCLELSITAAKEEK